MSVPDPLNNSTPEAGRPIATSTETAVAMDNAAQPGQIMSRRTSSASTRHGDEGGVDVEQAEKDFGELRRQLSKVSSLHRVDTGNKDPEKEGEDQEDFDLLAYLVRICFLRKALSKHAEIANLARLCFRAT
jgi:hypothetical protein